MKHLLITLLAMGLLIGTAQGQMQGPGDGPGDGGPAVDVPQEPQLPPLDVDPEVLADITALFDQVKALREDLRVSRTAAIEALGVDPTREAVIVALEAWRTEYAGTIETMQALSEELRALIDEYRPEGPLVDIPEDILADREELKDRRLALAESRRDAILALGEDPTDEAVREALEAWRTANADEIEAVRELAQSIRDWFRENRPGRHERKVTPDMARRRMEFRDNLQAMHENRKDLRIQMQDPTLTPEERHAIMQQFRQEQKDLMQERKQLKRQERIDQGEGGGDRRPGG